MACLTSCAYILSKFLGKTSAAEPLTFCSQITSWTFSCKSLRGRMTTITSLTWTGQGNLNHALS